jgi:heme/copper-type cytochrome/quinol oxidase subunit 1
LSRTVVYLFAAAAVVSTLATAYPPLSAVAQAGAAITLFAAAVILALSR